MARISIHLTRSALQKARKPDDVRKAALEAFSGAGGGMIFAAPFTANGQNFALSSRIVVEVDWLPGRVPPRVLREEKAQRTRRTDKA
ncbi:MAG: hypothetical protein KF723_00080 [Rhizobiaceae bacterium]|nr:hypothetical protein [Rhizobiaceae bacterium]